LKDRRVARVVSADDALDALLGAPRTLHGDVDDGAGVLDIAPAPHLAGRDVQAEMYRGERLVLAALAEERADALLRDKPFDEPVFGGRRLKVAGALQREAERLGGLGLL
jgi:hypothetical protein